MEIRNSKLNGNRMEVLGLVSIQLPSPWWWSGQDIEDVKAKGAAFRTFAGGEEDEEVDVAYLLVVDVTGDPEELNVLSLDEDSAKSYDQYLYRRLKKTLPDGGMELIEWLSSQLYETDNFKGFLTIYIVKDQGKMRLNVVHRIRVRESNLVIAGCFDIAMDDQLTDPIFDAIKKIAILPLDGEEYWPLNLDQITEAQKLAREWMELERMGK